MGGRGESFQFRPARGDRRQTTGHVFVKFQGIYVVDQFRIFLDVKGDNPDIRVIEIARYVFIIFLAKQMKVGQFVYFSPRESVRANEDKRYFRQFCRRFIYKSVVKPFG